MQQVFSGPPFKETQRRFFESCLTHGQSVGPSSAGSEPKFSGAGSSKMDHIFDWTDLAFGVPPASDLFADRSVGRQLLKRVFSIGPTSSCLFLVSKRTAPCHQALWWVWMLFASIFPTKDRETESHCAPSKVFPRKLISHDDVDNSL